MLAGESNESHYRRKNITAGLINDIVTLGKHDPCFVGMAVFSARVGLLYLDPPILSSERPGHAPDTPIADIRADGHDHRSRDGEMYKVPVMRSVIADYAVRTAPSVGADELRVELIGPQGSCINCALALQQCVAAYNTTLAAMPRTAPLTISLVTRWTGPQQSTGRQGTRYGGPDAQASAGPKITNFTDASGHQDVVRFDAPHWKVRR